MNMLGFNYSHGCQPISGTGSSSDNMAAFTVGQTVMLECTANIGTYNHSSAQVHFRKSSIDLGPTGALVMSTYPALDQDDEVPEPPSQFGQCQFLLKKHVMYTMTAQDVARPSNIPLVFDCYFDTRQPPYATPDENRPQFYINVSKCNLVA